MKDLTIDIVVKSPFPSLGERHTNPSAVKLHPFQTSKRAEYDIALIGLPHPLVLPRPKPYLTINSSKPKTLTSYWINGRTNNGTASDREIFHQSTWITNESGTYMETGELLEKGQKGDSGGPLFRESVTPNEADDGTGGFYGNPILYGTMYHSGVWTQLDHHDNYNWIQRTWDSDVQGCDRHQNLRSPDGFVYMDCAYVGCSNKCVPRGTGYCSTGCNDFCSR